MSKIDLGMFICSTKFGGSEIDSTPVQDGRIHCTKNIAFREQNIKDRTPFLYRSLWRQTLF